jgi:NADH-quinone oxidoreductase subunit M
VVLAAIYILLMYQRTMTGPPRAELQHITDLNVREVAALAPLVALILVLGFYPKPALDVINPGVSATLEHVGVSDPEPDVPVPAEAAEVQP